MEELEVAEDGGEGGGAEEGRMEERSGGVGRGGGRAIPPPFGDFPPLFPHFQEVRDPALDPDWGLYNHLLVACDMADRSAIVRIDAGFESRELQVYVGDSHPYSSPSTSLEEGGGGLIYELYDELEKSMAEEDKSLQAAFEDSMRRREALQDALNTVRMREREDFEEALARKAKEVESMSQQVDKIAIDLCIALDEKSSLQNDITKFNQTVQESEQSMVFALEQLEKYKMEQGGDLQEQSSNMVTPLSFSLREIEGAIGNFDPSRKIGQGCYGPIYRGFLRHTQVSIKILDSQSMQGISEFQKEVCILSKYRHPNIVTLIGSCPDACIIIYEYLPNGSLEDRLSCRDNSTPLSWKTRVRIAAELCSVLIFLHSDSIVHGDLKPDNILLDSNYVCKLSDFGIRRVVNQHEESSNTTGCYIDPDFSETGELTPKSDVYSLGVILLRLLTGNKSAVGLQEEMQNALDEESLEDILDPTVEDWPFVQAQQLAGLAMRCCERNYTRRPDLKEVWRLLEPMRASCDISSFQVSSEESRQTPPYFVCPILQDIMQDPHVAADGYTYELEGLRGWLDRGKNTSPMTNLPLPHCNIVPNHSLRSAIQEWQQLQRQ